jgi:hypothetical protein
MTAVVWLCALAGLLATSVTLERTILEAQQSSRDLEQRRQDVAGDRAPAELRILRGQVKADDDSAALLRRARVAVVGSTRPPVFTDENGRFEIGVPAKAFAVRITKPGFAPQQIQGAETLDPRPIEVRLARGAAIQGHVIDGTGAPAVDARVTVRLVADTLSRGQVPVNVVTRTDDLGEFRVGSLPGGRYNIAVEAAGERGTLAEEVAAAARTRVARPPVADPDTAVDVPPPTIVAVRTAEQAEVTVLFDRRTADYRAATAYVAGFEDAASQAARNIVIGGRGVPAIPPSLILRRGTATVTGRVLDPHGRPMVGAIVRLNPVSPSGVARVAASDPYGMYQFPLTQAGSYRLAATKNRFLGAEYGQQRAGQPGRIVTLRDRQRVDRADIGLLPGATVTGTITDPDGEPIEGIAVHAWRLSYRSGRPITESAGVVRRTDDRGRYRLHGLQAGTYFIVAADDPSASESLLAVLRAPKLFYPGTDTIALATPVHLDGGAAAAGIDLSFAPPRSVRVAGTAIDSQGNPLNRPVVLVGSTRSGFPAPAPQVAVMKGIQFEFPNVAPGEYIIQAMQYWGDVPGAQAASEFTAERLTVGEQDVDRVDLHTEVGSTVGGRIVFEKGGRPQMRGNWLQVMAADPDFEPAAIMPRPWTTIVNPDLSFQISGLTGALRFTSTPAFPPNVWLKRVDMGGVNLADEPALFGRRDGNSYVEVVLADDGGEISGRVVNGRKEPVASFVVAVFPVARADWYSGSRYMRIVHPDEQAQFTSGMLPPGEYWVAAVDALDDTALQDPDVLKRLSGIGRRVVLNSGSKVTTELPLARMTQ